MSGIIGTAAGIAIGGAAGYGAGAIGGAAFGGNSPGSNIESSSAIGGMAGLATGAVFGAAVMNPIKAGTIAGKAGLAVAEVTGAAALKTAEVVGGAAINSAATLGGLSMGLGATAVGKYGSRAAGIASKLVKPISEGDTPNILGHKATGLGIGLYAGSKIAGSFKEGFDDFNRNRMGSIDTNIRRATPRTPSYAQNAGATGDLVFAMNKNRRG